MCDTIEAHRAQVFANGVFDLWRWHMLACIFFIVAVGGGPPGSDGVRQESGAVAHGPPQGKGQARQVRP